MQEEDFKRLVARLEQESAKSPGVYRAKVLALTLLGFGILALLLGVVGLGLLLLVGLVAVVAFTGGKALLLLAKFGKLVFLLAIPLWYLIVAAVKALFVRLPAPQGRELTREEAPALFAALDDMRQRMRGPRFHHVLIVDEVNAAVVQRPAWGLFGWPRNYLLLGLPLLECMTPHEALAVVAHEYGHLAGSHSRFSAFIYRLRHTWGTVQDHVGAVQGWLAKLVAPMVRWYAPYFNAYTFVLARADEYQADKASAQLVGHRNAAHALKRVNVEGSRHERFMERTFERIEHEVAPPADLLHRWAAHVGQMPAQEDAREWLVRALDRRPNVWDTHPTLRARLDALALPDEPLDAPPPQREGASAAQDWLGPVLDALRAELQSEWAQGIQQPWAERHEQRRQQRQRLQELSAMEPRGMEDELEQLQLLRRLEPQTDLRAPLQAFNAAHPDNAMGLFLHGCALLDAGDPAGLARLDGAMNHDEDFIKPACERAYAFLKERNEEQQSQAYAERWRQRDAHDELLAKQWSHISAEDTLQAHGLAADVLAQVRANLTKKQMKYVGEIYLARRLLAADPQAQQWVLGVKISWWGSQLGKQQEVVDRLAAAEWPVDVMVITLDHQFAPLLKKLRALADARLA